MKEGFSPVSGPQGKACWSGRWLRGMGAGCWVVQQESMRVFNVWQTPAELYPDSLTCHGTGRFAWRHGRVRPVSFPRSGVWLHVCSLLWSRFFQQCLVGPLIKKGQSSGGDILTENETKAYIMWISTENDSGAIRINTMSKHNPQSCVKWELYTIFNMRSPECLFQLAYEV